MSEPQWLTWARQIQAIAQAGQHYTTNPYDRERFDQLEALAAEIVQHHSPEIDNDTLTGLLSNENGYATPKLDIRGVVLNTDGAMLLVRENADGGRWTLPGGWADVNVAPSENVQREVLEEAGYRVQAVRLLAALDRRLHGHPAHLFHIYKLFFLCELLDPNPVPSPQGDLESGEAGWFPVDGLPPDDEISIGRVTNKLLRRMFALANDPALGVDFD